jgi:type II secretion system protein H
MTGNTEYRTSNIQHRTASFALLLNVRRLTFLMPVGRVTPRAPQLGKPESSAHGAARPTLRFKGPENSGFTLIELMVVVAIIAIMTAMIIPEMKGTYQDALLRSTGRDLVNALDLAHSRAVSFNQPHRVRIDSREGVYIVEKSVRDRAGETFRPLRDVAGGEGKLDSRIKVELHDTYDMPSDESVASADSMDDFQPDENTISFYSDGTADAKEILLQDQEGFRLALKINGTTAHVAILTLAQK